MRRGHGHAHRAGPVDVPPSGVAHQPGGPRKSRESPALDENVREIKRWEQTALHDRSAPERLSDWITALAGSGWARVAHLAWFAFWILANLAVIPAVQPFDPFPFPLLTTIVSIEAIFLALFVLASQNRLSRQADKRAHLDLQDDLLAEREMTVVLQLLQDIASQLAVKVSITPDQIRELTRTDIHALTHKVDGVQDDTGKAPKPRKQV